MDHIEWNFVNLVPDLVIDATPACSQVAGDDDAYGCSDCSDDQAIFPEGGLQIADINNDDLL